MLQDFLTAAIEIIAVGFALVMAIDFVQGRMALRGCLRSQNYANRRSKVRRMEEYMKASSV